MKRFLPVFVILVALASAGWLSQRTVQTQPATSYDTLVKLYEDMRASQRPADVKGVPDYSATTVQARRKALDTFGVALDAFDSSAWQRSQRVDHLLVLAQWRTFDFELRVLKPWARDPNLYVDMLNRVPFTELPLSGQPLEAFKARLRAVPEIVAQAKANLTEGAAEQTKAAIRSLEMADGVGHGHPYRAHPRPA